MDEKKTARIAVVGSCNVDLTVFTGVVPRGGETVMGSEFQMSIGGKGTNQATAACRAGGRVEMVSRVGDDGLSHVVLDHMDAEGICRANVIVTPSVSTGTATIIVEEATGQNRIVVAPGANGRITPADAEGAADVIRGADVLLLQLEISVDACLTAARIAKAAGVKVVLNPAPACALPPELLGLADFFTPNETEAEFYTGIAIHTVEDAYAAGTRLLEMGVGCAVITLGKQGAVLVDQTRRIHVPAMYVERPVDTTGAGDCFNGVLAVALAEGMEWDTALHMACTGASLAVQRKGAAVSCPTRAEIDEACK